MKEYTIWQNYDLNLDDYKDEIIEAFPEYKDDKDAMYECMIDMNNADLDDTIHNLRIDTFKDIVCIADLGLWNGRHSAYKDDIGTSVSDCFRIVSEDCDYVRFYIDNLGDFRAKGIHHDGTNTYLFRAIRDDITDTQRENFLHHLRYNIPLSRQSLNRYTVRIGDIIAKVYGWKVRKAS